MTVTYWEAIERADHWRRCFLATGQRIFADVAREWLHLARWMRLHHLERSEL